MDPGRCEESLELQYYLDDGRLGKPYTINSNMVAISPGHSISLSLHSCHRIKPRIVQKRNAYTKPWVELEVEAHGSGEFANILYFSSYIKLTNAH